jgi:hypothetical protein
VTLGVVAALLVTSSGCESDQVPLSSPTPDAAGRSACRALVDALPNAVADQLRRPVDPADALGAAYGDPAIVLLCGGEMPADFDQFSPCVVADGVGWYIPEDQLGNEPTEVVMTTIGFRPVVQVTVPRAYWREGASAAQTDLATAIKQTLTRDGRCR